MVGAAGLREVSRLRTSRWIMGRTIWGNLVFGRNSLPPAGQRAVIAMFVQTQPRGDDDGGRIFRFEVVAERRRPAVPSGSRLSKHQLPVQDRDLERQFFTQTKAS